MSNFDELFEQMKDRIAREAELTDSAVHQEETKSSVFVISVGIGLVVRETDGEKRVSVGLVFNEGDRPYMLSDEALEHLHQGLGRMIEEIKPYRDAGIGYIPAPPNALLASILAFVKNGLKRGKTYDEAMSELEKEVGGECPCEDCQKRRAKDREKEASMASIIAQIEKEIKEEDNNGK